jgi:hypothetical protein
MDQGTMPSNGQGRRLPWGRRDAEPGRGPTTTGTAAAARSGAWEAANFQASLVVCLPRDVAGVRLVHIVMDTALAALGVTATC